MRSIRLIRRQGFSLLLLLALWLLAIQVAQAAPLQQQRTHIVRRGENLTAIAARYGTTVSALVQANSIRNPNYIYVGQKLVIPGTDDGGGEGGDGSGDGGGDNSGGDTATTVYVVRAGDTLSSIALRYGTSIWTIARLNGLRNVNYIYVGQRLIISGGGDTEPTPQPVPAPTSSKWIDIDLTRQTLRAYVGSTEVYRCVVSTGRAPYYTVTGQFRIYSKYLSQAMAGPGYYLPNVPHVMYFYRGFAIHGAYWHNKFGTPTSHGCVNLTLSDAAWMYSWAPIGTLVVSHW